MRRECRGCGAPASRPSTAARQALKSAPRPSPNPQLQGSLHMATPSKDDSSLMANAIRALAMDAVQQANSGHPGAPMGMAEIAVALWDRHLKHNPRNPHWPDRDRFVLSNGHALDAAVRAAAPDRLRLAMSELRNFRQLHSKTPGHPEVDVTPGVETTTGPLGQGTGQCGGHGAGREAAGGAIQPPRPCGGGPPHLCLHGRRLPDGRHQPRGLRAGRRLEAEQAGGAVRRQRHQHRRRRRALVRRQRRASASRPMAGTSSARSTGTTWPRWTRRWRRRRPRRRGRR